MRKPELRWTFAEEADPPASQRLRAWDGERLLGGLLFAPEEGRARISRVAVEPDARDQGIGRMLMAEAEAEARRLGLPCAFLQSRDGAVGFYARLGYSASGARYAAHGVDHQDMSKELRGPTLRPAAATDICALRALLFEHGRNEWNYIPEEIVVPHLNAIASDTTMGHVAEWDRAVIGFVTYVVTKAQARYQPPGREREPHGYLCEAVVHSGHAGKGVGTLLLRAAAQALFAKGCREVYADRHEENAASAAMMRKAGFELIAVYQDLVRRGSGSRRTALCRIQH